MTGIPDSWRHAEQAIGDPTAVAEVTGALPPRLAVLLRAMEALDAGVSEAVQALADEVRAVHPDVAAVLDVTLAPRTGAPRPLIEGVPDPHGLALADLLAAYDVARAGRPGEGTQRLADQAGLRPLYLAAYWLLVDEQDELYSNPVVRAASPRADALHMAARAQQLLGHPALRTLYAALGELPIRLQHPRWDLSQPSKRPGDLVYWAATRSPWTDDHDHAVEGLLRHQADARLAALGTLLRRVRRDLLLGRVAGMARPVRAAVSLAWFTDEVPDDLRAQLSALQLRLDRFDPEATDRPARLLQQLWRDGEHLSIADRGRLAEHLLALPLSDLDDHLLARVVPAALASTSSSEAAGEWLLDLAVRTPPDTLLEQLAAHGASEHRTRHLAGLHAASAGFAQHALRMVPRVLEDPHRDTIAASQILRTVVGTLSRRETLEPGTEQALALATDALASADTSAAPWGPLVAEPRLRAQVSEEARSKAVASASVDGGTAEDVAASLLIVHHLGSPEQLKEAVRALGRRLRTLPGTDAEDLALTTLGWVFAWNPGDARTLVRGPLRPLDRYLLREHGTPAALASGRLPETGPVVAGALDWWLFTAQDEVEAGAWRNRLRGLLAVPPEAQRAFRQLVLNHDLSASRSLDEAVAHLQDALQPLLDQEAP